MAVTRLMRQADQISFSLFGARVTSEPGVKIRDKISRALVDLQPCKVDEMCSASHWLGTNQRASLIVIIRLERALREKIQRLQDPFFQIERWEDWALYKRGRVLAWSCTHEREGWAYGTEAELLGGGLKAVREATLPVFRAELLEPSARSDVLDRLRRLTGPSG